MSTPESIPFLPSSSHRIPELDGLRGFAILQVVLFHYLALTNDDPRHTLLAYFVKIFGLGWSGVDLFFVLSGFLIGGILLQSRESPRFFQTFYLRRVYRILPIYFLWISIYAAIVSLPARWFPAVLHVAASNWSVIPIYGLFVQNLFFKQQLFQWIWFAGSWSLAIEEQFYLIAPPLIRFFSVQTVKRTVIFTILFVPLLRSIVFLRFPANHYLAVLEMPCRADEFAVGVGCALLWRAPGARRFFLGHTRLLYQALFVLSCAIAAALWWFLHPISLFTVSIGYSLLATFYATLILVLLTDPSGILARLMRLKFLRDLGGISYCVYLIHVAVNALCHGFLLHSDPRISDLPGLGVTLLAGLLTFALAKLSWTYFERPLVRRGHRYSY